MPANQPRMASSQWTAVLILGVAVAVVAILGTLGFIAVGKTGDDSGRLLLMVIGGVVVMLLVIGVLATVFSLLGLTDSTQAMALPEGSIRAVIALSLLVLFIILAVFLYDGFKIPPGGTANTDANEFAKQIMTALGTLLTAVASFYFGAKTATSAASAAASQSTDAASKAVANQAATPAATPATVASVNPNSYSATGATPMTLTIVGTNLKSVTQASLVRSGSATVPLTGVQSNPTQVTGQLAITANMSGAAWDVVLADAAGNTTPVTAAFTITP